jgi:hypothetical protein
MRLKDIILYKCAVKGRNDNYLWGRVIIFDNSCSLLKNTLFTDARDVIIHKTI